MPHPLPAGKEGQLSLEAGEAAMTRLAGCGVCLIGPGLGRGNGVAAVVRHLLGEIRLPVVLDADGINALEGHIDVLDSRRGLHTVLTPHDGEFVRLGGELSSGDRLGAARAFAVEHACCLVLSTAPSPPSPTARPTSTPTAIRAWPRGGAATCWQG
ncbi:MAG: NAD(P)H-hydrate dehydratase [Flavonifractor plautii]